MFFIYIIIFLLICLAVLLNIFLFYRILGSIFGAPYAGSSKKHIKIMIDLAGIKKGQTVVDLGSGDGRVLIAAAKMHQDVKLIGFEIDIFLYLLSKRKIKRSGLDQRIKIYRKNYWRENINYADAVFLFLIPYQMGRMENKLKKELKPGAKIISNGFKFKKLVPIESVNSIYLYKF